MGRFFASWETPTAWFQDHGSEAGGTKRALAFEFVYFPGRLNHYRDLTTYTCKGLLPAASESEAVELLAKIFGEKVIVTFCVPADRTSREEYDSCATSVDGVIIAP